MGLSMGFQRRGKSKFSFPCDGLRKGNWLISCRYEIRVGRSTHVRGPFLDKTGRQLLDGGGTVVYGSNHGDVYAPGGLGVLPENDEHQDILYYHYSKSLLLCLELQMNVRLTDWLLVNTTIGFLDPVSIINETGYLLSTNLFSKRIPVSAIATSNTLTDGQKPGLSHLSVLHQSHKTNNIPRATSTNKSPTINAKYAMNLLVLMCMCYLILNVFRQRFFGPRLILVPAGFLVIWVLIWIY